MSAIDCCIRHAWTSETELHEYLPAGWREYMLVHSPRSWHDFFAGFGARPIERLSGPLAIAREYRNPLGDLRGDGAGGHSPELLGRQHLDPCNIGRAVLCYGDAIHVPGIPTVRLAVVLTRAINDWTIERWLSADPRLHGVVLVATQAPEQAAAEIERVGRHPCIAGVLMAAAGLAKPFGHPVYEPIHRAAHALDLPIVLMAGGDTTVDAGAYSTAGGIPGTYLEQRALAHQSLQTHIASLITQGVMHRYPSLRFLVLGGGIGWVTPWLWHLDTNYKAFRYDALWLGSTAPSEVFKRHFLVGTHPFNYHVGTERLAAYLALDPGLADVICYGSGYPDWDSLTPGELLARLPAAWHAKVAHANARAFFRWEATGRVEDWRAGLGRGVPTMPRFQPPPRRTQRADFPHCAPPFASCRGLWDLSCWGDFRPVASHSIGVEQPESVVQPRLTPSSPAEALSLLSMRQLAPDLLLHPIFDEAEALTGVPHREVVHPSP